MKSSVLITAFIACALSAPIVSAQEKAPPTKPAMSMDMDKQMPQMRENMKKMQQQMEKIQATSDPAERQKLMQDHMQTMQENMKVMHSMGGSMMSGGQHGVMMLGGKKGEMASSEMMKRNEMMDKRLDMMQMMMEQMIQHARAVELMPAK